MATTEPQVTLNSRLPLGLMQRLERAAFVLSTSKVEILRRALEQFLTGLEESDGTAKPTG